MLEIIVWPAVVFLLGIFGFLFFRKPLARLIDRTTNVSKTGIVASAAPQDSRGPDKPSTVPDFLKRTFDNALVVEQEDAIKKHIDSLNPVGDQERIHLLTKLLAAISILRQFDSIYNLIYGSQIAALQHLNDFRGTTLPVSDVKQLFEIGKANDPAMYGTYGFDGWLRFLESNHLIQKEGDNVTITLRGREFLKYMIDQGYTFLRRG